MKIHFYIILVLISLLTLSCKKNGSAILEGTVYEEGSNVPIGNAYVRIFKVLTKVGGLRLVADGTTDENGHYVMKYFRSPLAAGYTMDVISGEHISILGQPIDLRKSNFKHILTPYAWIKVRIKSNLPKDAVINVTVGKYQTNNYIKTNADSLYFYAYKTVTNKPTEIKWSYYLPANNQPITYGSDTVLISNKFDTLIYTILVN